MESEQPEVQRNEDAETRSLHAVWPLQSRAHPALPYRIENVNALFQEELTPGDRIAIRAARLVGSWTFIIGLTLFLAAWGIVNIVGWVKRWDPYPFVLMNLFMSLQATYTAPLIMMAQNREAAKDRLMLREDYETNCRAAEEIRQMRDILEQHGHLLELLFEERKFKRAREAGAEGREVSVGASDKVIAGSGAAVSQDGTAPLRVERPGEERNS